MPPMKKKPYRISSISRTIKPIAYYDVIGGKSRHAIMVLGIVVGAAVLLLIVLGLLSGLIQG